MKDELYSRELRWMELLAGAFNVFSMNIGAVLKVMLVIFLPISLLEGVILDRMLSLSQALQQLLPAAGTMAEADAYMLHVDFSAVSPLVYQTLLNELLYFAVLLFLQPVGTIAVAKLAKQRIEGRPLSVKEAILDALQMEPAIIVSGILWAVLVFLGSILIVPGIYFSIAWSLYLYAIGLSGKKGWDALKYSKSLVQGRWLKTVGVLLLLGFVSLLWNSVFELVYVFGAESAVVDTLYYFLCYFSAGFVATGEAMLFLNREAVIYGKKRSYEPDIVELEAVELEEDEEKKD